MTGSRVKSLTKKMKQKGYDMAEPVLAKRHGGRLELQDGHHRTAAAIKAGIDKIPVRILE